MGFGADVLCGGFQFDERGLSMVDAKGICWDSGFCRQVSLMDELAESALFLEAIAAAEEDPSRLSALALLLSAGENRACPPYASGGGSPLS